MDAPPAWYAPAVPFVAGAIAGGTVKTFTAPLSRSTILLQTADGSLAAAAATTARPGAFAGAARYLSSVGAREGLMSYWKGNGVSILQKMATTGSNYFVYERLKEALRFCWRSDDDVGFKARLLCGTLAGAVNVTVASLSPRGQSAEGSRRRRGCHVDIPRRRVAAAPRL